MLGVTSEANEEIAMFADDLPEVASRLLPVGAAATICGRFRGENFRESVARGSALGSWRMVAMRMRTVWCGAMLLGLGAGVVRAEETSVLQLASAEQADAKALLTRKLAERDRLQREIAELREATKTPEQVLVRVRVLELNLTKIRLMGIDLSTFTNGKVEHVDVANWLESNGGANHVDSKAAMLGFFDTVERQKIGKVLAEPSVVTTNGQPASMNVGGEFPVPIPGEDGGVKIQKYGTQLDVTALALGDNMVRLNVRPRVSELDMSRGIAVGGQQIPALTVRECNFNRELEFGKSVVLSGLVQERKVTTADWLGRKSDAVEEFALVIVVTPEIMR
jgi:Flp pilus assembly secretin CpaC